MNIELVTIGTELLLGFTVDTNGAEIARALSAGRRHASSAAPRWPTARTAIRDGRERRRSRAPAPCITTGGLGPTRDDITKRIVADLFGAPLEFDEAIWAALLERFARARPDAGRRATGARPRCRGARRCCRNRWGTAPGLWLEGAPGLVDHAARRAGRDAQAARARGRAPARRAARRARSSARASCAPPASPSRRSPSGMGEIEREVAPLSLAYLPGLDGVDLRLTAWSLPPDEADARLRPRRELLRERAGDIVYGEGDDDLAALVLDARAARGAADRRRPSRAPAGWWARG